MASNAWLVLLGAISAVGSIYYLRTRYKTYGLASLLHPMGIFLLASLLDASIPMVRQGLGLGSPRPPWAPFVTSSDLAFGATLLIASTVIVLCGFRIGFGAPPRLDRLRVDLHKSRSDVALVLAVVVVTLVVNRNAGGIGNIVDYVNATLRNRWALATATEDTFIDNILSQAANLSFRVCALILFARVSVGSRRLVLPITAGVYCAFFQFSRGAFLVLVVAYMFGRAAAPRTGKTRRRIPKAYMLRVGLLLLSLTVVRQLATSAAWGSTGSEAGEAIVSGINSTTRGEALWGISDISRHYLDNGTTSGGDSFVSAITSPIPRILWPEKPTRIGVQMISDEVGWPRSSQNAVTTGGEALLNFGPLGLVSTAVVALAFGFASRKFLNRPQLVPIYTVVIVPLGMIYFWMGTTAVVQSVVRIGLLIPVSYWLVKGWSRREDNIGVEQDSIEARTNRSAARSQKMTGAE